MPIFINEKIKDKSVNLQKIIKDVYNQKFDAHVLDWSEIQVTNLEWDELIRISNMILNKEDITFEIGYRYFRNNKLNIEKGVFVHQFDTEQIVDLVLDKKQTKGKALEIGCGTGAISISLASETILEITAIDISQQAIKLANRNSQNRKIKFLVSDFNNFTSKTKYDLIISNPPYIAENDKHLSEWVKKNQPIESLYSPDRGLKFYNLIFKKSLLLLKENGYIFLEIGFNQADAVKKIAEELFNNVEVHKDLSGHDRFIIAYNGI